MNTKEYLDYDGLKLYTLLLKREWGGLSEITDEELQWIRDNIKEEEILKKFLTN